jgi:bifunctional non-homologous end joining protein LigD
MSEVEPPLLAPMLTGATGIPADTEGWTFEPKWDGVRAVARVWSGRVTLTSRLGNDVTGAYPELNPLGPALGEHAAVLDGEVIAFDEAGRPSFERLQQRMHVRHPERTLLAEVPVLYAVFDLLWLDGRLLTGEPLVERRRLLEQLNLLGPNWQTSPRLAGVPDDELMAACRKVGLEGYVAKLGSSRYLPGQRSKAWTKVKCVRRREFVVGGWRDGDHGRAGEIGSLAVGWVRPDVAPPDGHPFALHYAGQVGSGLNELLLSQLHSAFTALATDDSPFVNPPRQPRLHFVRPALVVEVQYTEVTTAGVLRQPSLKGLRNDIDPTTVAWTDELA